MKYLTLNGLLNENEAEFISNPYWNSKSNQIHREHWKLFIKPYSSVNQTDYYSFLCNGLSTLKCGKIHLLINYFLKYLSSYKQRLIECNKYATSIEISKEDYLFANTWFKNYGSIVSSMLSNFYKSSWSIQTIRIFAARSDNKENKFVPPSSYYWHRDSVGHSVKMWIRLFSEGTTPPFTSFLKSSHITPPIPQYWEMYRAADDMKLRNQLTETINSRLQTSPDLIDNLNFIQGKNSGGNVLLFNTNLMHKGNYTSDSAAFRYILEFQFNSETFTRLFA
tara:strand:- start:939 stop:1775 length:837 start_codon:yes stop_codon:yes gene_type:complete